MFSRGRMEEPNWSKNKVGRGTRLPKVKSRVGSPRRGNNVVIVWGNNRQAEPDVHAGRARRKQVRWSQKM